MDFSSKVGVKLLLAGLQKDDPRNMLTSPLSYNVIMNMLVAGSSGDTLDQILRVLQHKNIEEVHSESAKFAEITAEEIEEDKGGPIISLLNGVWVNKDYRVKESFQELLLNLYKAKVANIDCQKPKLVIEEINEWARTSTRGLIRDLLNEEDIKTTTILVIGNALYFKGSWKERFEKGFTRPKSFYPLNGEEIEVPFMTFMTGCKVYSVQSFQGFQVARIPYSDGGDVNREFAMYIFLPNDKDGLKSLLNDVDSNPRFFKQYCDIWGKVDIFWIPKFKFSYSIEESMKMMEGMGLTLPSDMEKAEFSEMIKDEDLVGKGKPYMSKIIQKTFIEVDEEGTEAAAVSARHAIARCAMNRPPPTKFIADHPFMFAIREENSGILFFVGVLLNPLQH